MKIICTKCGCEINPNAGYYNRLSGVQCVQCNEKGKETKADKIFAKKVECRKQLDLLLKGKLNDDHSKFPNDLRLVSDIEDILYKYAKYYIEGKKQ
jgi:hypothetical protein